MAIPTILAVKFRDAGPTISTVRYRLLTDTDDDFGNIAAVLTERDAVITALDVLTMDHIESYTLEFEVAGTGAAENVAANNLSYAFVRTHLTGDPTQKSHFTVPAWDDVVYDKTSQNLLSAAFVTDAAVLCALLQDINGGGAMQVDEAAARSTKRGDRLARRI